MPKKWYEGGSEIGGFSTFGDSGGGGSEPSNTWEGYKPPEVYTPPSGTPTPAPGGGGGGGSTPTPTGGGSKFNWKPDPAAAQKAWKAAGSPATPDVLEWFKNAVEAGSFLETGESSSETAYEKSGFSAPGAADITGMRAWAKQHGMSEDYDRWSEGQLMSWEQYKDASCPPQTPYRAMDGSGCVEKPIDSNKTGPAEGSGGGGGGGGTGGGSGTGFSMKKEGPATMKDWKPTREKVYGGGSLAMSMQPGGGGYDRLASGTPPQPTSQEILRGGSGVRGVGSPTGGAGGNMPEPGSVMPGSTKTGSTAVGGGVKVKDVGGTMGIDPSDLGSLLWPTNFGGL